MGGQNGARGGFHLSRRWNADRARDARNWSEFSPRCGANSRWSPEAEVTVECAPGTLAPAVLRGSAALRCEPREPRRAVVCGSGSGSGWPPAQARDRAGRHCSTARCGNYEHQHRSDRGAAAPDSRELGILSGRNHRDRRSACERLHARGGRRLASGTRIMAGGTRYHAHFVPDEEAIADFYSLPVSACNQPELRSTKFPTLPARASSHNTI